MIASFQSEDDREETARTPRKARSAGTRPKVTTSEPISAEPSSSSKTPVANAPEAICAGGHDGLIETGRSSRSLAFKVPPSGSALRNTSATPVNSEMPQTPPFQPLPPNSKLPKHIPQKRYRGPTPPPVEPAAITTDNYVEPPSQSTRLRTSLGSLESPLAASTIATTASGSLEPGDSVRKPSAHRQRIKSQHVTETTTTNPSNITFGLDGF